MWYKCAETRHVWYKCAQKHINILIHDAVMWICWGTCVAHADIPVWHVWYKCAETHVLYLLIHDTCDINVPRHDTFGITILIHDTVIWICWGTCWYRHDCVVYMCWDTQLWYDQTRDAYQGWILCTCILQYWFLFFIFSKACILYHSMCIKRIHSSISFKKKIYLTQKAKYQGIVFDRFVA
jgi:hypothetical protein